MQAGRRIVWTNEKEINGGNIAEVLRDAWAVFTANRSDCSELIDFEKGIQPLTREKTYRSDIDIVCIDNVANEIVTFKTGYQWSNDMLFVQRGVKDSGDAKEHDAIALFNECFTSENVKAKTQELAYYVETTGIGYTFVDVNTDYEEGDSFFKYEVLDPMHTFIVRSLAYIDRRPVMGVTFREDTQGNQYFTCFTPTHRYELAGISGVYIHGDRSGDINPMGMIPIVEWIRAYDRMGCFERQIDDMNTLNIEESDFANLIDQNVQAIWHANDVEFAKNEDGSAKTPKSNDWVFTQTTRDGKTPFITPLAIPSEYTGIMTNISSKRAAILQKCNIPARNDNSGGSTGVAMSDATGWTQADVEAQKQQSIMEGCKMQEAKLALRAIRLCASTPSDSPLLRLRHSDIKPNIKRQKNYEMVTKANTFATLISHGVYGLHVINAINFFDDPQQVWEDSKENIEKYQKSLFEKQTSTVQEKAGADESDQIENSPNIDGMNREDPDGEDE